jgi:hypothetical protein
LVHPSEDASPIEDYQERFARIEAAVDAGQTDLSALGFWRLLRKVKLEPMLSTHWAPVAGRIDRKAFEGRVRPRFPVWFGNAVLFAGTGVGVAALVVAIRATDGVVSGAALVAGGAVLQVTTHDLAHWAVGRLAGIRFLAYFLNGPFRIQPGLKTDYETYVKAAPGRRAVMHAAGAVASKLGSFVALALWPATDAPAWAAWASLGLGVGTILTDVVWSTKKSDWKKVRREARLSRAQRAVRV